MTKQELLKKVHKMVWKSDDLMDQNTLFDLQYLIDIEIIEEAKQGNVEIKQSINGYITSIKLK